MKTLYILRHAKTEPADAAQDDISRRLSPLGREACEWIGAYIKLKKYLPSLVLCSPSKRTSETYDLVMQSAGVTPLCKYEKKLYLATPEKIIDCLHDVNSDVDSLMIIGHNPGMHQLAFSLAQPVGSDLYSALGLKYPPGALTVLKFPVKAWLQVLPGEGELVDFMVPANQ